MLRAAIVCLLSAAGIWAGLALFHSAWAALLLYHLVLAGGLLAREPGQRDAAAVLRGWRPLPALLLVLCSAAFGVGLFAAIRHLDPAGTYVLRQIRETGLGSAGFLAFAIYTCTVNPILEELYWRANYREARGWVFDIFYALLHIPLFAILGKVPLPHWPAHVCGLTLAGLLWRLTARRCGGLAPSVAGHAAGDVAVFVAIALATP